MGKFWPPFFLGPWQNIQKKFHQKNVHKNFDNSLWIGTEEGINLLPGTSNIKKKTLHQEKIRTKI